MLYISLIVPSMSSSYISPNFFLCILFSLSCLLFLQHLLLASSYSALFHTFPLLTHFLKTLFFCSIAFMTLSVHQCFFIYFFFLNSIMFLAFSDIIFSLLFSVFRFFIILWLCIRHLCIELSSLSTIILSLKIFLGGFGFLTATLASMSRWSESKDADDMFLTSLSIFHCLSNQVSHRFFTVILYHRVPSLPDPLEDLLAKGVHDC